MATPQVATHPAAPTFRKVENISTIVKAAKTKEDLPERYVFPDVGTIDGTSSFYMPVIDLAGLSSNDPAVRSDIAKQIGDAASDWGFFQVVNHGFPKEHIEAFDNASKEFFALPVEVKERGEDYVDEAHGYEGRLEKWQKKVPWMECLAHWYRPEAVLDSVVERIWPGGNPTFCKIIHDFSTSAEKMGEVLMGLLAESLGLKPEAFAKYVSDKKAFKSAYRVHHYPACPDPSRALGAMPHSDTGILTILKQDHVGGLQVRRGERYVDVKPVEGAFVINCGDTLEALSNGRFRSVDHRVVTNAESSRYSLVYSYYPGTDMVIECPPELVDEIHPSLYFPFTGGEFRAKFEQLVKNNLISRERSLSFCLRPQKTT